MIRTEQKTLPVMPHPAGLLDNRAVSCPDYYPQVMLLSIPTGHLPEDNLSAHYVPMDDPLYAIRKNKLNRVLVEQFGTNQTRMAEVLERQPDYISRVLRGSKNLGERLARKIETKLNKPRYWLDIEDDGEEPVNPLERQLLENYRKLSEELKNRLLLDANMLLNLQNPEERSAANPFAGKVIPPKPKGK